MNCHTIQPDRLKLPLHLLPFLRLHHPPFLIHLGLRLLQPRQRISPFILRIQIQHLPKHRALPIQMRRRRERHEELAPVDSGTGRVLAPGRGAVLDRAGGHGEDAARVVPERGEVDLLVQGGRVVDGGAALGDVEGEHGAGGCAGGGGGGGRGAEGDVATLDHETRDEAVERGVVVCAGSAEGEEVLLLVFGMMSATREPY